MAALSVIDHFGRRKLMVVGSVGYILSLSAAAGSFYTGSGGGWLLASLLVFGCFPGLLTKKIEWSVSEKVLVTAVTARADGRSRHQVALAAPVVTKDMSLLTSAPTEKGVR